MHNLFLLLGTIIGAGIFSLPIALSKSGFLIFFALIIILAYLMAKVNWFYREIVTSIKTRHQLSGYVRQILGPKLSFVSAVLLLFSTIGALLAYLILAGDFIAAITPLNSTQGSWLFYLVMFLLLYFGGKQLEALDVFMTVVKVIFLTIVIILTFNLPNFVKILTYTPADFNLKHIFLVYGTVLFSLTGYSIVPELKNTNNQKQSINLAQILSALFYVLFSINLFFYVYQSDFVLQPGLIAILFNLTGIFCVLTPYLMLSWVSYDLFDKDLGFDKKSALILTAIIPLLLYLIGMHDFLAVISVSGGVFLGGIAIIIARMYAAKFPGKHTLLLNVIQIVFGLGALAEIIGLI